MINKRVELRKDTIIKFCQKWEIRELALFGSVLRDDFGPNSDVDMLVSFSEKTRWTLFDLGHMQEELQELLGVNVDLVSRRGIEASRNRIRREEILNTAKVIYVA